MPRKAFVADLQEAIGGSLVEGISDLQAGEEDGSFTFVYTPKSSTYHPVPIHALVTDVGDYPHEHQFMLFTTEENPAPVIGVTLNDLQDQLSGVKVCKVVSLASSALSNALSPAIAGHPMDVCDNSDTDQSFEGDSDGTGSYGPFSPKSPDDHLFNSSSQAIHHTGSLDSNAQKKLLERLRTDIRMTKEAGFRVGVIGNISSGCNSYLSVSCRIAKLGISEEAMQAWQLKRQNYLILIIRYPAGYVHADKLADRFYRNGSIEMRVATTSRYKPTLEEATAAFSKDKEFMSENKEEATNQLNEISPELAPAGLQGIFIGRPLNDLLNERLVNLMQLRMTLGFPWEGAEAYFNDHQGKDGPSDKISHTYWIETPSRKLLPPIVTADHLGTFIQERRHKELSFPLLAAQFMLRHTVSCTEFCLVCHSKVEVDFEALKPYVCEKPLCLYQYMTLGMGPSIEFEIISQPNVVDLLVCFCYSAAVAGKLNGFPTGMGLIIPPLDTLDKSIYQQQIFTQPMAPGTAAWNEENAIFCPEPETVEYTANYDPDGPELIFDHTKYGDNKEPNPLRPGDWIVVQSRGETASTIHHRVADISFFPTVQLSHPVRPRLPSKEDLQSNQSGSLSRSLSPDAGAASKTATKGPFPMLPRTVTFSKYERNFDDLHSTRKQLAIILLLSLLPSVTEMKEYLMRKGIEGASLRQWTDRLPPAAVNLLRWIIASNRSCIFEVEGCDTVDQESVDWGNTIADPFQQRIPGFQGCLQFRFAQGAPDKEQRFIRALQTASEKLSLQYESIFAWHGSPMYNWHGIVREGLHFREMQHGRAYGNGCYHSLDYNISAGYCGVGYNRYVNASTWPQSALRISSAVCLNEIVNSPAEFVSREPHLVVAQVDWIQTRYLFVRTVQDESNGPNTNGSRYNHNLVPRAYPSYSNTLVSARVEGEYPQDPRMNPRRDDGQRLIIPLGAIASSRRRSFQSVKDRKNKKAKVGDALWGPLEANKNSEVLLLDDDVASIETSVSDLEILFTDTPNQPLPASPKGKNKSLPPTPPQTDFVPGTLDHSTLPILRAPSDATIHATRWLQRELQAVLKLQKQKPAHELGWYIDSEHIENPYQWILEMHSFDPELPLVKDMRDKGIKSIVLEMRFGKDCPMAPPFVRVIRPRFLPFMQRGGGHVTAGGALCMELLTNSGWSAVSSIESVLLQVRMAMSSTDPFPARLDSGPVRDYGVGEAVDAYIRACAGHGWEVPKDFMSWANPQPSEPPPNPYWQ